MSSRQMTLRNFPSHIDMVILERGLEYFEDDRVTNIVEKGPGTYVAKVHGTRNYTVEVALGLDDAIQVSFCNCPYDGPICKHEVSVYYALRDLQRGEPPAQGDLLPRLRQVLAGRRVEELVEIIMETARADATYFERLLFRFVDEEGELELSRQIMWSSIKRVPHIDTVKRANQAMMGAHMVADKADLYASKGAIVRSIDLYLEILAVASEVLPLEYEDRGHYHEDLYDDEDEYYGADGMDYDEEEPAIFGDVIAGIESAVEQAVDVLDRTGLEDVINKLLAAADSYLPGARSMLAAELLSICSLLATDAHLRARIMRALSHSLEQLLSTKNPGHGTLLAIKDTQYQLIKQDGNSEAITDFLLANIDELYFLHEAVLRAGEQKDYHTVLALAETGQRRDPREIHASWRQVQLEANEKLGNTEAVRSLAFELLTRNGFNHYPRLRGLYSEREWLEVQQRVVEFYQGQGYVSGNFVMFLEAERLHDLMLAMCRKDNELLLQWYRPLLENHKDEICQLLTRHIWNMVKDAQSRSKYQAIRLLLVKHREACGADATGIMVAEILRLYPRKSALREELSRL